MNQDEMIDASEETASTGQVAESVQSPEAIDSADEKVEPEVSTEKGSAEEVKDEVTKKKPQSYYDKRLDKLHAGKMAETQRADRLEAKLLELEGKISPAKKEVSTDGFLRIPKEEDYDYDTAKYQAAVHQYNVDAKKQLDNIIDEGVARGIAKSEKSRVSKGLDSDFNAKVKGLQSKMPDWHEKMESWVGQPDDTFDCIKKCNNSAEIVYYLASNPDIAGELSTLSSMDAAVKIGHISSMFSAKKVKTGEHVKKPNPIEPISGSSSKGRKSFSDMTPKELDAHDFD